ncbi:MAG TPA: cadmium resistance transporter [Pyrinomonadaceae bacterium]|nr:cadmium resistance transporter [Pyrinomonadaceae bacterium]
MHWLSALGRAIVAFAATNIDDIFVLTLFFAQKNLRRWHVVVGQYLGLAGLITISLVGYFAWLIIPQTWIGLLGLAPIAIGIKKLMDWQREKENDTATQTHTASVFTVATVTFANGGDNIGIYVPLFANSDAPALFITLITFAALIAVWCVVGYYVGNHPAVTRIVDRYGHILVPFVLIGLGIYIIINGG